MLVELQNRLGKITNKRNVRSLAGSGFFSRGTRNSFYPCLSRIAEPELKGGKEKFPPLPLSAVHHHQYDIVWMICRGGGWHVMTLPI